MDQIHRVRINCWQNKKWLPEVGGHKHNAVVEVVPPHKEVVIRKKGSKETIKLTANDYTQI